ncbi:MAG: 3'-5' exonuclease [Rickettsiales bacterium]|jgi:predicted PolB exonuclease-like 3'-5' exonuclease|nr:3'-5' exonuclease [Rickettsiales bacterium]
MALLDELCVFDVETIPDVSVLASLTGSGTSELQQMRKELEDYHIGVSRDGNPFPRQPFHRIVAISLLRATIHGKNGSEHYELERVGTLSSRNKTEEQIVRSFFDYFCGHSPRIVGYNSRTFDLPVLKYRAMKYAIPAAKLFMANNRWENYSSRYSLKWHCDLLETLSDFGLSARCKMNEVCSILGIPGKMDGMDGSKVTDLFDCGNIEELDSYCETDVLSTYLIYLNYALLTGLIAKDGFMAMNEDLLNYLRSRKKENFNRFIAEWEKIDSRGIF